MRDMDILWAGIIVCMVASLALFWFTALVEKISGRAMGVA
jgi:hypothetical protein